MPVGKPTRRHFTDAARAAAAEARRRKREMRAALHDHRDVFVVRQPDLQARFCWEIRWFGGVVVDRGEAGYRCVEQARSAGQRALSSLGGSLTAGSMPGVDALARLRRPFAGPSSAEARALTPAGRLRLLDAAMRLKDPAAPLDSLEKAFAHVGRQGDALLVSIIRTLLALGEIETLMFMRAEWLDRRSTARRRG